MKHFKKLFVIILLLEICSCSHYKYTSGGRVYGETNPVYITDANGGTTIRSKNISNIDGYLKLDKAPYSLPQFSLYVEKCEARGERRYINWLKDRIEQGIDSEKNEKILKKEVKRIQSVKDKHIQQRMDFLRTFYTDLYKISPKDFSKKYRKHCTGDLLQWLSQIYKENHEQQGFAWAVFGDNAIHKSEDFTFSYLDGNWNNVDEKYRDFMYGDVSSINIPEYPYCNTEDKWFKVSMNDHEVMVRVDGEYNTIAITSVLNPHLNMGMCTDYDTQDLALEKGREDFGERIGFE